MRGHWRKNLKRDIAFFQDLESTFEGPEQLSGVLIVRKLGNDFVKRYRRGMSFLAHENLIIMDDDPDYPVERAIDRLRVLTRDETVWIQQCLERFLIELLNARARIANRGRHSRIPVSAKSLESAVRSAHRFLAYARDEHDATSIRDVSQEILDQFVGARKYDRTAISAFLRYVRKYEKTFQSIKLRKIQTPSIPAHLVMSEQERLRFMRIFSEVTEPKQIHWALACAFNLLYAQSVSKIVKIHLDQVRQGDDGYEVKFAKVWLAIDPAIQPLMARWMNSRREFGAFDATGSSPYLFPGMRTGTHLTPSSLANFRKKHHYDTRAGRVTAISALIRHGLKQIKVLTDCFGISAIRAHAYLRHFGAHNHDMARHVYEHHAKSK
ncbi:MAG: hypothetical protein IAE66_04760 [Xanthomonadaceae bacterium]|nr:hypothetical protein [Xanthomonadaceae bacterium]